MGTDFGERRANEHEGRFPSITQEIYICLRRSFPALCRIALRRFRRPFASIRKIFDSCRDQDCIEDLRFYLVHGQTVSSTLFLVKTPKPNCCTYRRGADQFQPWILYCGSALFLPRSAAGHRCWLRPAHGSGRTLCV